MTCTQDCNQGRTCTCSTLKPQTWGSIIYGVVVSLFCGLLVSLAIMAAQFWVWQVQANDNRALYAADERRCALFGGRFLPDHSKDPHTHYSCYLRGQ